VNVIESERAQSTARSHPRPTGVRLLAIGMLLLQLGWTLALPPFRGIDEFDHVYKTAAVARGDWFPTPTDATRGTGLGSTSPLTSSTPPSRTA
jgi:hypothetical protein